MHYNLCRYVPIGSFNSVPFVNVLLCVCTRRAERRAAGAGGQHGAVRVCVHWRLYDGGRARHLALAAPLRAPHPHHRGREGAHGE